MPRSERLYRIHPLVNGRCVIAGNHAFYGGDPSERWEYFLYLWLVEGGDAPILIDAGLENVDEMNHGAAHVLAEPITQRPEERTVAQLARMGVRPEDVGWVFITHLHFDHVDQLELYRNARIVVSAAGLKAAVSAPGWRGSWAPFKTLAGLTGAWKDRVVAVDDVEVLPGMRVRWLGGHSPCNQGVFVRTAAGTVACPGDVVPLYANLERDVPPGVFHDLEQCRKALQVVRREADVVLPSHDPFVVRRFPDGVG